MKGTEVLSGPELPIRDLRRRERRFFHDGDERVEPGVVMPHLIEAGAGQRARRDCTGPQCLGGFVDRRDTVVVILSHL